MINNTSTVMIATVIIRFVAILFPVISDVIQEVIIGYSTGQNYLRPIPLNVFTLRST